MAPKLSTPIEETIFLHLPEEEGQKEDLSYVVVRQATQKDAERRSKINEEYSRIYREGDEVEVKMRSNQEEFKRLETYMTLIDCNIEAEESTPEKPVYAFKFRTSGKDKGLAMSEGEFAEVWGKLPAHWATAIHDAVLEVNKDWNPNSQG